jgi:hypothetical protein
MGTSKGNSGGTGGAWTGFKRNATLFAKHGGQERAGRALAGYVAAIGGAAAAVASAAAGVRTAQSFARFLTLSTGPTGVAGSLEALGLERLVGADRFTVLSELVNAFAGSGNDLEAQAARSALLDVLDRILPDDEATPLDTVQLDEAGITEALCRYISALIYNRAIPVIDERLTLLQNAPLAQQRDQELREYIDALVRLRMQDKPLIGMDWQGQEGREFVEGILRAVYDQVEAWQ